MTFGDPWLPQTISVSVFCIAFHVFVMGEHRNFKFGMDVDHIMSQLTHDKKTHLKGMVMLCDPF